MLPDGFPAGLRVFVIDEDSVVLRMLEKMLLQCDYKVTISDCPLQALELLRANAGNYDIVLIDVNLTCMDGFQLLGIVSREINLPVIVEQKQQQNSFESGAQIITDSVDVQSYSLEDHGGSNTFNFTILSEFDNMDDTDELYVALSQFQY